MTWKRGGDKKKKWSLFLIRKWLDTSSWGLIIPYDASHGMPVVANGYSVSILAAWCLLWVPWDITWWLVGLYMLELFVRYYNLIFIVCDHHRKMRFKYNDTKIFRKNFSKPTPYQTTVSRWQESNQISASNGFTRNIFSKPSKCSLK